MVHARSSLRQVIGVYGFVCVAVFAVTRLEPEAGIGRYVHLLVAAIFLLTAVRLTRDEPRHYGVALAGLLEPAKDERPAGPLGLFDLGRALRQALPIAAAELTVAIGVAALVFPLYGLGFYMWHRPDGGFSLAFPSNVVGFAFAQLIVVALPEEAFFRGYLQTALSDLELTRLRVFGVSLAPWALVFQASLFAAIHFMVEPDPARLAVFFPALLFGWMRAWRGGIGAALALHAMSNLYSEILGRSWL
ncbi:MAG: MrtC family glutamic-type intramembrane protease [Polyangiales bacterium]